MALDPYIPAAPTGWAATPRLTAAGAQAAFERDTPHTLGVEEELMVLDPESLDLVPDASVLLGRLAGDARFVGELPAAQIEIVTPVCARASEICEELAAARAQLVRAAAGDYRIAAAGTHPFARARGELNDSPRYRPIAAEYSWAAARALVYGQHVHVAVGGAERALRVFNALRSYLPHVAALAANAPYLEGADTGLASVRPKLAEALPRQGIPPPIPSWEAFAQMVDWGRAAGSFPDASHLWWELRPHPPNGTLELRVPDAQTSVADAAAVAAVCQALVAWLADRDAAGEVLPVHETWRIEENRWRALRYGLHGWLADLDTGTSRPTRERIGTLLDALGRVAERLGSQHELAHARTLLGGNGADRQRYVAGREGLTGLVRHLADVTER